MSDRARLLAYVAGLAVVLVLAFGAGRALAPSLGYDEPPPTDPTHEMTGKTHP